MLSKFEPSSVLSDTHHTAKNFIIISNHVCFVQIEEEWVRFGAMRTMMREACGGTEVVTRDDVTRYTQNLYEWVEDLDDSGDFEFGVPRHSQLIRRVVD